ncbi:MAG TPA: redoxin domain-containing protein [Blastocatellia bacterium]|jgi:peroxiredoxin/outer membrane lipoprotein-sorting protein|nr:redoxin domain-containing protein [Blastocatellia bacterium]
MKTARVISISLIGMLIMLSPSRTWGQDGARALLDKVAEKYNSLKQYQFEGTTTMEMKAKGVATAVEMQTVFIFDGPNRRRIEMRSPVFGFVSVTNGDTTWLYLPALNQYMKVPAAEMERKDVSLSVDQFSPTGGFGGLLKAQANEPQEINKRVKQARILREETLYPQGAGVDCIVVEVEQEPAGGPGKEEQMSAVKTIWIEKERSLIIRQQTIVRMKGSEQTGGLELKTVSVLRNARINEPVPESSFTFAPPSGAKLVDQIIPPGRGGDDDGGQASPFVGKEASDLSLKDMSGKRVELKSLRGKVVLLDFWATWCAPCREEMPHLEKLHRELKDKGLLVVGINTEDAKSARSFMKKYGYTFMTLIDGDGAAATSYKVDAIPTVFVIDKEGKITGHYIGGRSEEDLREAIKRAGVE